jgi:hypothetical protein
MTYDHATMDQDAVILALQQKLREDMDTPENVHYNEGIIDAIAEIEKHSLYLSLILSIASARRVEIWQEDYNSEAVYREIPSHGDGPGFPDQLAEHWLAAREFEQDHQALLATAEAWYRIHTYLVVGHSPAPLLVIRPEEELTK